MDLARWLTALASLLLLLAGPATVALGTGGGALEGTLSTADPATTAGEVHATTADGVLHLLDPGSDTQIHLRAEAATVETAWERGYDAPVSDGIANVGYMEKVGRDSHNLTQIDARITGWKPDLQALALLDDASAHTSSEIQASATVIHEQHLAKVGVSEDSTASDERLIVGFWYEVEGPWSGLGAMDTARVTGDLTLFVNNATIDVLSSDTGPWTDWTGYRADDRVGDADTPEGTVTEYERRVTVMELTNATLWINATDRLDLYAPELAAEVNGSLHAPTVAGELTDRVTRFRYDDDPLHLRGQGSLQLAATPPGGRTVGGHLDQAAGPSLELTPRGAFAVQPTPGVEMLAIATDGPAGWLGLPGAWLLGAAALIAVPAAVLATRTWRTQRTTDETAGNPQPISAEQLDPEEQADYDEALLEAQDHFDAYRFQEASKVCQALTDRFPQIPDAWQWLAHALEASGEYERAADAYDHLEQLQGSRDRKGLVGQLRNAWLAEDEARAASTLVRLSQTHPQAAIQAMENHGLAELAWQTLDALDPQMIDLWLERSWEEGRRGDARRLLGALITREPGLADPYIVDPTYTRLLHGLLDVLHPASLAHICRLAWHGDRLQLARDAFARLVQEDPSRAVSLLENPGYETLGDDPRIQHLLPGFEPRTSSDTDTGW